MQRVPPCAHGRFLDGLAQRRMRVNRAGHVFQPGAHFQSLRKCRAQFQNALADSLPSADQVIVAPGALWQDILMCDRT